MEIETSVRREFLLDEDEAKLALWALDYLYHRHTKHGKFPGISVIRLDDLRAQIREGLNMDYGCV